MENSMLNNASIKRKHNFGSAEKQRKLPRSRREHLSELNYVVKQLDDYTLYTPNNASENLSWGDLMDREDEYKQAEKERQLSKHLSSAVLKTKRTHDSQKENCVNNNKVNTNNKTTDKINPPRPKETDPIKLKKRQRQIDIGKNTEGYRHYIKDVARLERTKDHPWTPNKHTLCSTRSWQGNVRIWRRKLHFWDPEHVIQQRQEMFFNVSSSTILSDEEEQTNDRNKVIDNSLEIEEDRSSCSGSHTSSRDINDELASYETCNVARDAKSAWYYACRDKQA